MDKQNMTPEQRSVVENRGGALLVSAAAGSGKTMVLIGRLMDYICDLENPKNINDFLIITYTRAAAGELRSKISAELNARLADCDSPALAQRLRRQLGLLYLAQISTVHAFCANILRQYAWKLDLAPDFRVAEERDCADLKQAALDRVLEARYSAMDRDFVLLADTLGAGRDDSALCELTESVYNAMQSHPDPQAWLDRCAGQLDDLTDLSATGWGSALLTDLRDRLAQWQEVLDQAMALARTDEVQAKNSLDRLGQTRDLLGQLARAAEQGWEAVRTHPAVRDPKLLFPRFGSSKGADPQLKAQVSALRDSCKKAVGSLLIPFQTPEPEALADLELTAPAIRALLRLTQDFAAAYAKQKSRRNLLDFSDLEHQALALLVQKDGTPSAAAREIAGRFSQVLVDEYQDTNAVQDAIFTAVSQDGQNLFFVGDVKQSIYRFRLADPTLFLARYHAYAPAEQARTGEPRKILLSRNFRSRPEVLEAANGVFSQLMCPLVGGLAYTDAEALRPGASYPDRSVPVELHVIAADAAGSEDAPSADRVEQEAAFVARRIRQLLDEPFQVTGAEGTLRPVTPGDIVILMRSPSSAAGTYLAALQAQGIPAAADRGGTLLEAPEVRVLLSLLAVIDNPRQDIPLAAVLASPVFGFTADDLAQVRLHDRSGSFYDAVLAAGEEQEKVRSFLSALQTLRDLAPTVSVGRLVWAAMQTTSLETIYAAGSAGAARRANLLTVFRLACQFEESGSRGLGAFLTWLEAQRSELKPAARQTDAVSIVSIHKSKGLEYPVVFLSDLARRFNTQDLNASVLLDPDLGAGAKAVDLAEGQTWPTVAVQAISGRLLRELKSEELRVLYVAMTRAKEKLILTDCSRYLKTKLTTLIASAARHPAPVLTQAAGCLGDWVLMHAVTRPEAGCLWDLAELRPAETFSSPYPWLIQCHSGAEVLQSAEYRPSQETEQAAEPADPAALEAALRFRYPHIAATRLPTKRTATQLKGRVQDQEAAEETRPQVSISFPRPRFSQAALTAAERGTAVHLAMQYGDYEALTTPESARRELDRLAAEGYLTAAQAEAVDPALLSGFFGSTLGQRVLTCPDLVREFKFSIFTDAAILDPQAAGEQILLQGMVDCCLMEEDGLVILDFKTDRVFGPDLAQRAESYRPQLDAYADALSRIFQKPVKEKLLYFFLSGATYALT